MAYTHQLHDEYDLYQPLTRGIWPLPDSHMRNITCNMLNHLHKEYVLYQPATRRIWPYYNLLHEEYGPAITRNMASTTPLHKKYCLCQPIQGGIWPLPTIYTWNLGSA